MSEFSNPGWSAKFGNAILGIAKGVQGQSSFYVHLPVAFVVLILATFLRIDSGRFSILVLCIGIVFACELFNSAIERIAKSITTEFDRNIGEALDIASGAVLVISIATAVVGGLILIPPVLELWK